MVFSMLFTSAARRVPFRWLSRRVRAASISREKYLAMSSSLEISSARQARTSSDSARFDMRPYPSMPICRLGGSLIGFHDVELAHIYDRGDAIHSRLLHAFSQLANHDAQGEIIAHLMASHQVAKEYLVEQTAYPRTLVAHHQVFRQSAIPEIFLVTLYDIIPILIDSVLVVQINTLKTKIFLERKRIDFYNEIFLVDKVNAFCPI